MVLKMCEPRGVMGEILNVSKLGAEGIKEILKGVIAQYEDHRPLEVLRKHRRKKKM